MITDKEVKLNTSEKLIDDIFPHYTQDNILDKEVALTIQNEILELSDDMWDRYDNPFEQKFTLRDKNNLPQKCNELFTYLTSEEWLEKLSKFTGYKLINDPTKNFWGVHKYRDGDYLDIHTDAGMHPQTKQKKQITLGIYLSKDWKYSNAGHLQLWSGDNASNNNAKIYECKKTILPLFNRLVLFSCNDYSWHGNPEAVKCKNGEVRIFLTISYLSENYGDLNKKVKAFFVPRPNDPYDEKKDKLRMLRCDPLRYKEVYRI